MFLLRLLVVFSVLNGIEMARKVKRKESYHLHVPPPPPQPPSSQHHKPNGHKPPYQYEDVQHHQHQSTEYSPNHHQHQSAEYSPNHHQHQSAEYSPNHHQNAEYPPNHQQSNDFSSNHHQVSRYESDYVSLHTGSGASTTYLTDNGLRNIAKGSADQANSAVASQNAAGKQAAYVAKSTLAQAAAQAASTAVAVLKGKEVLLRRLEEQSIEVHKSLEGELTQLQQAKRAAKAAQYSAQQAINHVSVLTAALNNAQSASEVAQKSASEAAAELSSQIDMVAQAKNKVEQVESHLYSARLDYEETKEAAEKATLSAQEAQVNANDAAVHANFELSEPASHTAQDKKDTNSSTKK